ncbi:type IV conjugative transfer system pilin TraA [Escherichia coli]|uniref:type IV conjugative transfer system pilin TraA n=1 Tax=Escherichia coli TaxID=562 RepID=UPI003D6E8839
MDAFFKCSGCFCARQKEIVFSKFTRLNMLRLARAVIPAAVLMMFFPQLAMAAQRPGLMASGNTTVRRPSVRTPVLLNGLFWLKFLVGAVMYNDDQKRQVPGRFLPSSLYLLLWVWPSLA